MRSSARSAALVVITVFGFAHTLPAQTTAKQRAAKTAHSSVSGRITIKDKPAPGVMVGLRRFDGLNPFEQMPSALTDQDGVYHITNVAAGSYHVVPSTPAYVSPNSDYNVQPVVVNEDENVENVNFSLVRGGVITGKVTDADGRPVIQIQVDIFRADAIDRQAQVRQIYPVNSGLTDDRGIYRVYGLLPGKYKVAAGRSDEFTGGFSMAQRNTFKQVFHPDVSDSAKATVVVIGEAGEAKDVDINLGRAMQTFSVSGHVINTETGRPVPNVRYGLSRIIGERSDYVNTGIAANERGDFITEGLLPGKYAIVQYGDQANELRLETMTFEVVDQDITDLAIKLAKGGSINGVVVLESDDKAARSKLSELQLRGYGSVAAGASTSVSSMIAADGGFHFGGLQNGVLNIALTEKNMPFPPKGFAIARIERDGVRIPQLEVKDGESMTGVKVFVSYGTASLRGVIAVENGSAPNARFAVRLTRSGENNAIARPPQVDSRGHFLIEGLPAGVYDVTATMIGPGKRYQATRSVTLVDGVVTDIALTIDLTPSPQ